MKRLFAFIIALCIITAIIPISASADNNYAGITEAADDLRIAMINREPAVTVYLKTEAMPTEATLMKVFELSLEEAEESVSGDYLHWHIEQFGASGECAYDGEFYYSDITYSVTYYTTAKQEAELTKAINELIESFGFAKGVSDYVKVETIYNYICNNVEYDYDNLPDDNYKLKYTAYAALINKTAVCQGYANLFYRLLKEVGVHNRIIAGRSKNQNHAWNIVEINGLYYNADSTWDAGAKKQKYFLKCANHFKEHDRDKEYETAEFSAAYPMAEKCYAPSLEISECEKTGHDMGEWYTVFEATCTENGEEIQECNRCDYYDVHLTPRKQHTEGDWVVTTEPEEGKEGKREKRCTVCNTLIKEETIAALSKQQSTGDLDGDNKITSRDYVFVRRYILNTYNFNEAQKQAADINHDGNVNSRDYVLVRRHILKTYTITD